MTLQSNVHLQNSFKPGQIAYFEGEKGIKQYATILWIGTLPPQNGHDLGILAGLECDKPIGQGNGMFKGIRYFTAKENHAAFVPISILKDFQPTSTYYDFQSNGFERSLLGATGPERGAAALGAIGAPVPKKTVNNNFVNNDKALSDGEEECYFESDEDLEEKLDVNLEEVERRMNLVLTKKRAEEERARVTAEKAAAKDSESKSAEVQAKESSDQWSKVAENLKKAPSKVQENLNVEKPMTKPVVVKKKEKAPVYHEELAKAHPNYKKTMCHFWLQGTKCGHGDRCLFAHGDKELRVDVKPKTAMKKVLCHYHQQGYCRNGDYCGFAHGHDQLNTPVLTRH